MMVSTIASSQHNHVATSALAATHLKHLRNTLDNHFNQTNQPKINHTAIFPIAPAMRKTANGEDTQSLKTLAKLLTVHCNQQTINHLLIALLASPTLLRNIAARSYWHGNGFLKIVLLDRGYKLRLHIWFAGTPCEENIHSHRWEFASHVITGTLKSELWEDAANDDALLQASNASTPLQDNRASDSKLMMIDEYVYTAKHQHAGRTIEPQKKYVGQACLRKTKNVAQSAGTSYVMTCNQLHRIDHPGNKLLATVICTAPTAALTNRMMPNTDTPKLQPARLSTYELYSAIRRYLVEQAQAA